VAIFQWVKGNEFQFDGDGEGWGDGGMGLGVGGEVDDLGSGDALGGG